jgi:hypothetical protein
MKVEIGTQLAIHETLACLNIESAKEECADEWGGILWMLRHEKGYLLPLGLRQIQGISGPKDLTFCMFWDCLAYISMKYSRPSS